MAALALGTFYGPEGVGREVDPPSEGEDGPRARVRRDLQDAVVALGENLSHASLHVRVSCALALAKIGGMDAWMRLSNHLRSAPKDANPEAGMALLLSLALLPGSVEGRLQNALGDEDFRLRAVGALGIGVRAVQAHAGEYVPDPPEQVVLLDRATRDPRMRSAGDDAAEATWARGALALLGATPATWAELYEAAIAPSTDDKVALAAAQALLFAPAQDPVRPRIADFASRENAGSLKPSVLAAFLVIAGQDGSPAGVSACAAFLRSRAKTPRAREKDGRAHDVRHYAAVALARALAAGDRLSPDERTVALDALSEALRVGLAVRGEGSFHATLSDVLSDAAREALAARADARLPATEVARLEAAVEDREALLAHDPLDVAVHRLGFWVRFVLGLEGLKKVVGRDESGGRTVNPDGVPKRYLLAWMDREPYLVRRDLLVLRGRTPFTPPPEPEPGTVLDR
jgi:hypothetical protein